MPLMLLLMLRFLRGESSSFRIRRFVRNGVTESRTPSNYPTSGSMPSRTEAARNDRAGVQASTHRKRRAGALWARVKEALSSIDVGLRLLELRAISCRFSRQATTCVGTARRSPAFSRPRATAELSISLSERCHPLLETAVRFADELGDGRVLTALSKRARSRNIQLERWHCSRFRRSSTPLGNRRFGRFSSARHAFPRRSSPSTGPPRYANSFFQPVSFTTPVFLPAMLAVLAGGFKACGAVRSGVPGGPWSVSTPGGVL